MQVHGGNLVDLHIQAAVAVVARYSDEDRAGEDGVHHARIHPSARGRSAASRRGRRRGGGYPGPAP
ncbi:MAG: hypothetical protein MZU97_12475 [Bacillus subtilis]|nr:hypothetical protein [Bacillus subtilis]